MDKKTRELLSVRTELIKQYRIAFRGGPDGHAQLEDLRAEIHAVQNELDGVK